MFADGQQQDSHEFLMVLLDSLHEELNKPKVSGATSLLLYAHERLHYAVLIGLGLLFFASFSFGFAFIFRRESLVEIKLN